MTTTLEPATTDTLPPGPRLPVAVQTVLFGRYRAWWVPRLQKRYGDVFMLRIAPFNRRMVMVARPDLIKTVFSTSNEALHAGEGNQILQPIMGDHSVLLLDEGEHLRVRQQLMPVFHGAPLRGYQELITELARAEVGDWPTAQPLRTHDRTTALALEIILQVVFGVTDERRLAELRPVVETVVAADILVMLGWSYPKLQRIPPWRQYRHAQLEFDRLIYAEIADRRTVTDLDERTDVLSRLIRAQGEKMLSDAELRDNLVTLLLAGHETTATALAWTFHELARNPAVLQRAQQAADEGDDQYLEAVFKEALRLHPVISEVARKTKIPYEIEGFELPENVTIMPGIQLVQRNPELHAAPGSFDPTRFLGAQPAANTWIPFGGGIRRCLGAGFSLMEGTVILREVLLNFGMTAPARPEKPKPRNVTLTPAQGGTVQLVRR